MGVAGGEGVGQYIHGISKSAAFSAGNLSTLEGFGTYIGYGQRRRTKFGWEIGTNLAYGYAHMETPAFLAAETNSELHHAWANLLVFPNEHVGFGFEWQHGRRETLDGRRGEDSHEAVRLVGNSILLMLLPLGLITTSMGMMSS